MVVIHHIFELIAPYIVVSYLEGWVCVVSMSLRIRSSLRDQLHVSSVFELVARLRARVDVIFVYVMQIRQKLCCPIN